MGSSMWTQTTASSNGNGLLEPSGNYVGFDSKFRRVVISPMAKFSYYADTGAWKQTAEWAPTSLEWMQIV